MNQNERTLLEGALRSVKALILHGMISTEAEVIEALKGLLSTPVEPQSLKDVSAAADLDKLRRDWLARLEKNPNLVLLVPATLAAPAKDLLAEVIKGELKLSETETKKLGDNVRLIAVAAAKPADELLKIFPLQVVGMRVLNEAKAARERAAEEHRAAQARARQSSREHGLA